MLKHELTQFFYKGSDRKYCRLSKSNDLCGSCPYSALSLHHKSSHRQYPTNRCNYVPRKTGTLWDTYFESRWPKLRQWESTKGNMGKSAKNIQGNPHNIISWFFSIRLCKLQGSSIIYFKWWKEKTYIQEYSSQQDCCSALAEKSKVLQTSLEFSFKAKKIPNHLYNKC